MENDNLKIWLGYDLAVSEVVLVCAETPEQASEVYAEEYDIDLEPEEWHEVEESELTGIRAQRMGKTGSTYTMDQWLAIAAYEPGFLDYVDADEATLKALDARAKA